MDSNHRLLATSQVFHRDNFQGHFPVTLSGVQGPSLIKLTRNTAVKRRNAARLLDRCVVGLPLNLKFEPVINERKDCLCTHYVASFAAAFRNKLIDSHLHFSLRVLFKLVSEIIDYIETSLEMLMKRKHS